MAFTYIGSHGTNQLKNATAGSDPTLAVDITISPVSSVAVGRILVVWLAADSIYDPANQGSAVLYTRMCCHDDAGNVYDTVVAGRGGTTGAFAQGAIFVSRIRNALTASNVITVRTQQFPVGVTIARAISVQEFSVADGYTWAATAIETLNTPAADPGAITISSLPASREYLLLHFLAAEGPETDAYTWDADYTQITGNGTTGGVDDTNIHIRGGYRIATLTTDTVDVTSDTADRDYTQGLVALAEVVLDSEFPTTPILDDFNRADEDPLDNSTWVTTSCGTTSALRLARILSNQCAPGVTGTSGGQWWTATYVGADAEVYATMAVEGWIQVILAGSGCANDGNASGLAALWRQLSATGQPIREHIECGQMGNTGEIDNGRFLAWYDRTDGYKMGIQRREEATHYWADLGSGWVWVGAVLNYGAYVGFTSGKLGFVVTIPSTTRMDDFGGGASILFIPQIYRRAY